MRCFVSIELPDNVKADIFHYFEKINNPEICSGNFVEKDNLHLTLRFFGDISEEKIEEIKKALSKIEIQKFPVETGKIGFFPNEDFVKVMWVELVSDHFSELKKEIDSVLGKIGFGSDETEFVPHLTVARIKGIKDKEKFFWHTENPPLKKLFFIAEEFSLVKSILKKTGPEYKLIENFGMRRRN